MNNLKIKITFMMMGVAMIVLAQEKTVKKANQQWIQYYNQAKLDKKWTLLMDGGFRWKDKLQESSQYIVHIE